DCNIRVDETITNQVLAVSCPNQTIHEFNPKCVFYCTATGTGCGNIQLSAINSPDVYVYIDTVSTTGLACFVFDYIYLLYADATELSNKEKSIDITCNSPNACPKSMFTIDGYDNVKLFCADYFSCDATVIEIANFSSLNISANAQGLYNSSLTLQYGSYVFVSSEDTTNAGQAFRASHWYFNTIYRAYVTCNYESDCEDTTFQSFQTGKLSMFCGSDQNDHKENCNNAQIESYENSSLNLVCIGGSSCVDAKVTYDANENFDSACDITCELNQQAMDLVTCENMAITVKNSKRGYDAIALSCEVDQEYESCKEVTITCGEFGYTCSCPVSYDSHEDEWYCDGKCGTSQCEKSSSSSELSAGAVAGIVLFVLVFAGVVICLVYQCFKKRKVESQLLTPLGSQTSGKNVQSGNNTVIFVFFNKIKVFDKFALFLTNLYEIFSQLKQIYIFTVDVISTFITQQNSCNNKNLLQRFNQKKKKKFERCKD
ncbi:hypothetical protein RFI_12416, partial [Reticulomyxa filosa]